MVSRSPSRSRGSNPYAVLGVVQGSSPEEVRKAFKRRALETHPDKVSPQPLNEQEKEDVETHFHEVYQAFEILNDPVKRREYDRSLRSSAQIKADFEKRWAEHDERSLQRARERQLWAEQAEERYQERRRTMRETKRKQREDFFEARRREQEDAEMVSRMLDALCDLGTTKNAKTSPNVPRHAKQRTERSASAPLPRQRPRTSLEPEQRELSEEGIAVKESNQQPQSAESIPEVAVVNGEGE
ncbi:DnaJ-domain-containing protein [Schizopora paradoxa]|uniref:DnaJ-domain-containing protein n=1 Tax=Schizopora paradoxa TaxID=27342 RepID=A0A0H2S1W9_9AGAM|nr:DnaJ-domain-containing protein [Schizopora paradoxa]